MKAVTLAGEQVPLHFDYDTLEWLETNSPFQSIQTALNPMSARGLVWVILSGARKETPTMTYAQVKAKMNAHLSGGGQNFEISEDIAATLRECGIFKRDPQPSAP